MEITLYRNDVKENGKTTRYYSIFHKEEIDEPIEVYLDILDEKIEIDDTELNKPVHKRNMKRTDRQINIDKSIKDKISLLEAYPHRDWRFSYIDRPKRNAFVWTKMDTLKTKDILKTPIGQLKDAKEYNKRVIEEIKKVQKNSFNPIDKSPEEILKHTVFKKII